MIQPISGADPGFFLGGGALVSCSTSTPINHIVFFFFRRIAVVLKNRRSSRGVRTPCTLPLDPPPRLTLKMTTAQVVETSVFVNNNGPIRDYVHPHYHNQPPFFKITSGFKPFAKKLLSNKRKHFSSHAKWRRKV